MYMYHAQDRLIDVPRSENARSIGSRTGPASPRRWLLAAAREQIRAGIAEGAGATGDDVIPRCRESTPKERRQPEVQT